MKFPIHARACAALTLAIACTSGHAALLDAPVPTNAFITFHGMQWAWASPVAGDGSFVDLIFKPGTFTGIDLSYQSQFGWRYATTDELLAGPAPADFLFDGANIPGPAGSVDPISGAFNTTNGRGGKAMACASPYFSAWEPTCNYANGPGLHVAGVPSTPWWGLPGSQTWSETLVVRDIPVSAVPEPTTWLLMAIGLGAVGVGARRRRA